MSNSTFSDSMYQGPLPPSIDLPTVTVTRHDRPPKVAKPHEAKVAARSIFDSMVLTSPNMDHIPEYPFQSSIIDMYSDGRYGKHEYSRWPQDLKRSMWHVACIPSRPLPPDVPAVLWETLLPETHWVQERVVGLTKVGYIVTETQDALLAAATSAIRRCEEMNAPDSLAKYGQLLVTILRRVMDSMRFQPNAARVAIGVAAHVQRVCLELAGLKMYAEVVNPRLRSMLDYSASILPVVGAFVRDGSDAQTCVRAGLPTYFLRPLTHGLVVWEVVDCRTASFGHSIVRLAGVPNPNKDWLSHVLLRVSEYVAGTNLAPIRPANVPQVPDHEEQHSFKRRRVGNGGAAQLTSSKNKHRPKLRRSNPEVHVVCMGSTPVYAFPASTQPSDFGSPGPAASLSDPARNLHPSKNFTPSPFYDVSSVWATALQAASPVARASTSATYYYPPPFLLDTVSSVAPLPTPCAHPEHARMDDKAARYIHNFVRIRQFCRIRIFDVTIKNEPLNIDAWRTALWGDYELSKLYIPSRSDGNSHQNRSMLRYEERKSIACLFGIVAHLSSYREEETVQLADMQVDIGAIVANPRVRPYVLWETHEVNFRAELLCLDMLMVQDPTWSFSQKLQREYFVTRVWGPPSSLIHIFPNNGPSNCAFRWFSPPVSEWKDCCETLRHFTAVLSSWPGCPDAVRQLLPLDVSEEVFVRIQTAAVNFYVRTFVQTFGRLPIPPIMPSL